MRAMPKLLQSVILAAAILLTACGGGGGGTSGNTPPPAAPTISGSLGALGAGGTLSYTNGAPMTATADGSGNYTFTVSYGWTGTVTPTKAGCAFLPTSLSYANLQVNQTGQTYTTSVAPYAISGSLGAAGAGATLSYTDGAARTATADGSGNYSFNVSAGWSGTVTPVKPGYTFSPASLNYSGVQADQTAQDFTPSGPITYAISGSLGVAGATLAYTDGIARTAIADGSGNYALTVSYDWSGTVTPSLAGFSFAPANRSYSGVLADQTSQSYTPSALTYVISGALGASGAGATLSYTDGSPRTASADGSGNYAFTVSYNWSGTVTPAKTGFTFAPTSRNYTSVQANQPAQTYTPSAITYTISGSLDASGAGAILAYTDGTAKTVIADGSGNYAFTVSYNWSGAVTPAKAGYTFVPPSLSYANVLASQTTQNYIPVAITYTVSGTAGAGSTLSYTDGSPKTATADGSGNYSFTVSYNWSGAVTPSKTGFTFAPPSRNYTSVEANQPAQTYTPEAITYTISGTLGANGAGGTLAYTDGSAKTASADGSGNYAFTVSYNWSGTVTPAKTGYLFTPASMGYTQVLANQTDQNYQTTVNPNRTVSGTALITYLPFNAGTGVITPSTPVPWQIPANAISAVLADGTTIIPGNYNPTTGAYTIPNVPMGYYWLQADGDYIWTNQASVDLGWKNAGRQGVAAAASPTNVIFNTTGLAAWNDNENLDFYDFNSNSFCTPDMLTNAEYVSQGYPYTGATALTALTTNWQGLNLVDTTQGDAPRLVQLVDNANGTGHLFVAQKSYQPGSLTLTDGAGGTVGGSFSDVSLTDTAFINFARSGFAAFRAQYNPNGHYSWGPWIEFDCTPGVTAYGDAGSGYTGSVNWLDDAYYQDSNPAVISDLNFGPVSVPGLFPGFQRIVGAGENYWMHYQMPGTGQYWVAKVHATNTYTLTMPDASHPVQPMVGPPKNPTVNGLSFFSDLTDVGLTPTVAWSAPDLGSPQGYILSVYQLNDTGSSTTANRIARLIVDGSKTSVTLPSGVLAMGYTYYFMITAYVDSAYSPATAPYADHQFPYGRAQTASNLVTAGPTQVPEAPALISFVANPGTITTGGTASLTGVFVNGTGLITPGNLPVVSGTPVYVTPTVNTSYTLTVTNAAQVAVTQAAAVNVSSGAAQPYIFTFTASPATISAGSPVELTAVFTNGTGLITPGNMAVTSGTPVQVNPGFTTVYTLKVTNPLNTAVSQITTVTVAGTGTRTVQALAQGTYLPFNAATGVITPSTPFPFSASTDIVLADGSTTLEGTFNPATGVCSIPNVPAGYYWLRNHSTDYIWTSLQNVDLSEKWPGRPIAYSTKANTDLGFFLTGLAPWQDPDYIVLYDFNSNSYYNFTPHVNPGATSNNTVWNFGNISMIDTTQGDAPRLVQMNDTPSGSAHLIAATSGLTPGSLTVVDGATSNIIGSLSSLPQSSNLWISYSRSDFAALRSEYNPHGIIDWGPFIEFDSMPGATAYGDTSNWLDGIYFQDSNVAVTTDPTPVMVAAPALEPGFEWIAYAGENYHMEYQLAGTSSACQIKARPSRIYSLTLPDATHPIQPVLGPVRNPTINGLSLYSNQAGVGLTPTLAWEAPDLGLPQTCHVSVYQLLASGAATTSTFVAQFYLEGNQTSMTLPTGILTPGGTYYFMIGAVSDSTYNPASAPYAAHKFPYGSSMTLSNMVTP